MFARTFAIAAVLSVASTLPALAASGRTDSSGVLVGIFLGFCALIVVMQLVPAILMLVGMVKGVLSARHTSHAHVSSRS